MGTTTEEPRRKLFGNNRRRPFRRFTTRTTSRPTTTTTRRTSFIPRSATQSSFRRPSDEVQEDKADGTPDQTTKRFSNSNFFSPRSTTENPIAISSEDRRLLLSKLFGGRTRTPLG